MSSTAQRNSSSRQADVSDIFGTVPFSLKQHVSPHGRVTAVSMMKDEGPFVLEWVAHHLAIGFTDLVVYTNDCSDGTDDMLIRLEELGLVHHRRNDIPEGVRPQPSALKYAQDEPVVQGSDWVLVFDADEFLCIKQGDGTLDSLIAATKAEGANGIVITWRIFGSNGIQHWSRAPVTEQYFAAAPPMWNKGWGVKTLFQFDPDCWKLGIHRPKIKNKHLETDFPHSIHWLNGSGRPMESYFKFRGWRSIVRTVGYDWAQMNHYAIKSMDSYAIRKFRGNVNNKKDKYNAAYWSLQDRNEVRDEAALRHAPRRNEIFECLLTDPVLAELHHTAVDVVEARLGEFKKTPQYRTLIDDLKTASEVPITEVEAKPPKARDPEKIAAQMSEIEKKMVVTDKVKTASDTLPPRNAESHPYVEGMIKVGGSGPTRAFSNHGIMLPADPRIFTDSALQAIVEGKFMRNHARRLPGFICGDDSYLEIGAGISFLAALLARQFPAMSITAQEERKPLHAIGRAIWEHNGVTETQTRRLIDSALFHPEDDRHSARGMTELVSRSRCSVLYVNDPQVSAKMVLRAVSADPTWRPRIVIVGPRALAGRSDTTACKSELTKAGYSMPTEQPLAQALTFMFEALADADGNDET